MRFAERVFVILILIAIIMHVAGINGYEVSFFLGVFGLACIYLLFGAFLYNNILFKNILKKSSYKYMPAIDLVLGALCGITQALLLAYTIFRIQGRAPSKTVVYGGVVFCILFAVTAFAARREGKPWLYKNILLRTGVTLLVSLVANGF